MFQGLAKVASRNKDALNRNNNNATAQNIGTKSKFYVTSPTHDNRFPIDLTQQINPSHGRSKSFGDADRQISEPGVRTGPFSYRRQPLYSGKKGSKGVGSHSKSKSYDGDDGQVRSSFDSDSAEVPKPPGHSYKNTESDLPKFSQQSGICLLKGDINSGKKTGVYGPLSPYLEPKLQRGDNEYEPLSPKNQRKSRGNDIESVPDAYGKLRPTLRLKSDGQFWKEQPYAVEQMDQGGSVLSQGRHGCVNKGAKSDTNVLDGLKEPATENVMEAQYVDDLYNHLKGTLFHDEPYSTLSLPMRDSDSDSSDPEVWIRKESNVFDPNYEQRENQRYSLLGNSPRPSGVWTDVPHEECYSGAPCTCSPGFRTSGGVFDFDPDRQVWHRKAWKAFDPKHPVPDQYGDGDYEDYISGENLAQIFQRDSDGRRQRSELQSPRTSPLIPRVGKRGASAGYVDKIHDVPIRALSDSIKKRRMKNLGVPGNAGDYEGSEEFKNVRWRDFFRNKCHMDSRFDDFFQRDVFSSKFEDILESSPFKRRLSDFEEYLSSKRSSTSSASADSFLNFLQSRQRDDGLGSWGSCSSSFGSCRSHRSDCFSGENSDESESEDEAHIHGPECKYTCHHRCRQLITLDCEGASNEGSSEAQASCSTTEESTNGKAMVKESGEFESGYEPNDRPDYSSLPKEDIRRRIEEFNSKNTNHGLLMEMREDGLTFQGFIRVNMNLTRPINMSIGVRPPSIYDVLTHEDIEDDHTQTTSFYLPRDTVKALHITSDTTTREVISLLLHKFHITDNPHKFALYHHFIGDNNKLQIRKLPDGEKPLQLWLKWEEEESESQWKLVLQENETGEIMWEAFSIPELSNFLEILDREEKEHIEQLRTKYKVKKLQLNARVREIVSEASDTGESTA
ncbi:uncharacterized protein LOC135490608 isoform X1 [Lineus longissimus]|uniref:uncharacterized protein LOC135490608 isoform X1 n=1 Tax=Lineus longissimus TaxID=88925 RepID=UPI00315D665B